MKFVAKSFFLFSVLIGSSSTAQTILNLPPPGEAGYSALQSGANFSDGAASLYYNPANLAELKLSTGSQLHFTKSDQDLLPELHYGDNLHQEFMAAAIVIPLSSKSTALSIGYFQNKLINDTTPGSVGTDSRNQSVRAYGLGIRFGLPISIGITAKDFEQSLLPGDSGKTSGWAFDVGGTAKPVFFPFATRAVEFNPSTGLVWKNRTASSFYSSSSSGSLPQNFTASLGGQLNFFDMVDLYGGEDWQKYDMGNNWIQARGFSVYAMGYQFSMGWLDDPDHFGKEQHRSQGLEVNVLKLSRVAKRILLGDFLTSNSELDDDPFFNPLEEFNIFGVRYRPNPRFAIGKRWISSASTGTGRQGQEAWYWSISL